MKNKDIIIINNFLEKELIIDIKKHVRNNANNFNWRTNLGWDNSIIKSSAQVSMFSLNQEKKYFNEIINKYKKIINIKDLTIFITYYVWNNLSYIPFHNDGSYCMASTIYLNEVWSEDDGGLFLYKTNKDIKVIIPEFNKCIINKNNIVHGTTLTTKVAPYRETLQLFFSKNKTK